MYFLSLDTAAKTATACVSVLDNAMVLKPLARAAVNATLTHSESLLPMIDFCLENAGLSFADISVLAASVGPGSFTGVRIGAATAKGLAFSRPDLCCIGVSTLEALAFNGASLPSGRILLPVMDARRNQFYHAFFKSCKNGVKRLTADALLTYEEIVNSAKSRFPGKKITLIGDGAEAFYALFCKQAPDIDFTLGGQEMLYEDAFSVARCAAGLYPQAAAHPESFTAAVFNPVYLRASQAERERAAKDNA